MTPFPEEIVKAIVKSTGETIAVHGAEAARQLQLSTQVPVRLIFQTSGTTRTLKIGNQLVKLKHVNPKRLIATGTLSGLVISALYYLGRENVSVRIIEKIKNLLPTEKFNEIFQYTQNMPAWMSDIFYRYQKFNMRK